MLIIFTIKGIKIEIFYFYLNVEATNLTFSITLSCISISFTYKFSIYLLHSLIDVNLNWCLLMVKKKTAGPHPQRRGKILKLPEVTSVAAEYVELVNIFDF